jgi:hypothetical protein
MARYGFAALWLLVGCKGISEEQFIGEYEDLYCSGYVLCATDEMLRTVGQRECLQDLRAKDYPEPPECPFDREMAEACLTELATAGCDNDDPEIPILCEDVYTGCAMPEMAKADGPDFVVPEEDAAE